MDPVTAFRASDSYKHALAETTYAMADYVYSKRAKSVDSLYMHSGKYLIDKFCANAHHDRLSNSVITPVCKQQVLDPWTMDVLKGMSARFIQGGASSNQGSSDYPAPKAKNARNANNDGTTSRNTRGSKTGTNRSALVNNAAKQKEEKERQNAIARNQEAVAFEKVQKKQCRMLTEEVDKLVISLKSKSSSVLKSWFDGKTSIVARDQITSVYLPLPGSSPETEKAMTEFKRVSCPNISRDTRLDQKSKVQEVKNFIMRSGLYSLSEVKLAVEFTCLVSNITQQAWSDMTAVQQYISAASVMHPDKLSSFFMQKLPGAGMRFYFVDSEFKLNALQAMTFNNSVVFTWAYYKNGKTYCETIDKDKAVNLLKTQFHQVWVVASNVLSTARTMVSMLGNNCK